MYGTTQIGAIADYVDPRSDSVDLKISAKKILDLFVEEKANYMLETAYFEGLKGLKNKLTNMKKMYKLIKEARKDSVIKVSDKN